MAQGLPAGWPGYAPQPVQYAPPAPPPSSDSTEWLTYVVAAGVVAAFGLSVKFAVDNAAEHREIRTEIGGVDSRLVDYQQAHALLHQQLQAQFASLAADTAALDEGLSALERRAAGPASRRSVTAHAEPRLRTLAATLPPLQQLPQYYPSQPFYVPPAMTTVPGVAPSVSAAPTRRDLSLPPHLEAAVAAASRPASRMATTRSAT